MELMKKTVRVPGSRIECRMYIRILVGVRGPALILSWGYGSRVGSRTRQEPRTGLRTENLHAAKGNPTPTKACQGRKSRSGDEKTVRGGKDGQGRKSRSGEEQKRSGEEKNPGEETTAKKLSAPAADTRPAL